MIDGNAPADDAGVMDDIFAPDRERIGNNAPIGGDQEHGGPARDPETGRFAPRQEATEQTASPPQEPTAREQPSSEPTGQPDPNANRHVPLSELLEERKKFQERLEAEVRNRDQYWQSQLQQFQQPVQQGQQQQPPDIFEDPEAAVRSYVSPYLHQIEDMRLNTSEQMARMRHGDEMVNEAMQAAQQGGFLREFASQANPYGALVEWWTREKTLQEVGTDPAAYRKRIEEEVRQRVLAELQKGGPANAMQPGQPQGRFPTSLADQTHAGGPTGSAPPNREAVLGDIFDPNRDRRAW